MKISDLGGETALIELIKDQYGTAGAGSLVLGIGDDAALIGCGDKLLIVTADLLIENTHFRMDIIDPYLLGWKSAAVNISDVAAMGGKPTYSFISIGLPDVDVSVVEDIYRGIHDVSTKYGSGIAGGDTVGSSAGIVINVTQLGEAYPDRVAKRSGAKPGDAIIVTNTLGDSQAGLELLLKHGIEEAKKISEFLVERHLKPEPRVNEGIAAVGTGKVHAMMDLSDGLSSDLKKLCKASGVGAKVYETELPVSHDLCEVALSTGEIDPIETAASGGEDYELLITCDTRDVDAVIMATTLHGSEAAVIGEITEGGQVVLVGPDLNEKPMPGGWEHF